MTTPDDTATHRWAAPLPMGITLAVSWLVAIGATVAGLTGTLAPFADAATGWVLAAAAACVAIRRVWFRAHLTGPRLSAAIGFAAIAWLTHQGAPDPPAGALQPMQHMLPVMLAAVSLLVAGGPPSRPRRHARRGAP